MSTCRGCGEEIPPKDPHQKGRKRRWCREACRTAYKRQWARDHALRCVDCWVTLSEASSWKGFERCQPCHVAWLGFLREIRLDIVQGCYEDGWPMTEIGEALGRGRYGGAAGPEVDELRRRGRIGYRNRGYGAAA